MKKVSKKIYILVFLRLTALADITLLENDIKQIYTTFVKPNYNDEYRTRYNKLPMHMNNTSWPWEGKDFPRVISLLEFVRYISANNISSNKCLVINFDNEPELQYLSVKEQYNCNYNDNHLKHDLHQLDLEEQDFDFVMINQTLEHIYDPVRCLKNIYNHMIVGGILYINVPSNNIPHDVPFHYYTGYTPVGLGAVVQAAGFKILHIGQWGSVEYLNKLFDAKWWPDYRQIKTGLNDFDCPVITWIFAVK